MSAKESELGFGTEYEKVIFSEIIKSIKEKYGIRSYFNFPRNNLLGNTEKIMKKIAEKKEHPDLLWNFCEFENEKDNENFFINIEAFNPKYILIVTQNQLNPGTLIHYFYHRILGKQWDHGNLAKMTIKPIKNYSEKNKKYEILETGLFDAPWFILDVYEAGRFFKKLIPKSKQSEDQVEKSLFEHSPKLIRRWASHHNFILLKYSCCNLKQREGA